MDCYSKVKCYFWMQNLWFVASVTRELGFGQELFENSPLWSRFHANFSKFYISWSCVLFAPIYNVWILRIKVIRISYLRVWLSSALLVINEPNQSSFFCRVGILISQAFSEVGFASKLSFVWLVRQLGSSSSRQYLS